jgi:hypothetical protein
MLRVENTTIFTPASLTVAGVLVVVDVVVGCVHRDAP